MVALEVKPEFEEVLRELVRFLDALGPYSQRGVLTGGLVPLLYRHFSWASKPEHGVLPTFDIDWTFPSELPREPGPSLRERCVDAGYVVLMSTTTTPPVQIIQNAVYGTERRGPIYIEVLTPLQGSALDRRGRYRSPVEIQPGLNAQALRYLELLFEAPLPFDTATLPALGSTAELLLPHPVAYLLQKLLALPDRKAASRKKDLAYIFDVALLTRRLWPAMAERLALAKGRLPSKWMSRAEKALTSTFASASSVGPVAVRSILADNNVTSEPPREETISRLMKRFQREVFQGEDTHSHDDSKK